MIAIDERPSRGASARVHARPDPAARSADQRAACLGEQRRSSGGLPIPYPDKRTPTKSIGELAVARVPGPGQFAQFGSLADAVCAYFDWRGRALGAVSIDDLLTALAIGGVPGITRDEPSKEQLRELLGRDPRFGRLRNGYYAPSQWINKTKPPNE